MAKQKLIFHYRMKYKKTTLKNGLRIITVPMKEAKAVTVMTLVSAGSDYETKDINGLSHFLEHMCFQGTKNRPNTGDISRELDALGAQSNAFTSKEYTGYWAKAQKKHLPKLIDIVGDIYQNSIFDEDAMRREKGVVVEEMKMYEDLPQVKAPEVFEELLYGDQPAGWPVIGKEEVVKAITKEKLLDYRKKHYVAKGTVVVISGGFDEIKTIEMVKKAFESISKSKKEKQVITKESQEKPEIKIHYKETDQAHIVLGFRSENLKFKDNHKIGLLETILGQGMSSRLFKRMRDDLGICYYVRASNESYLDRGHFTISSGVSKDRIKEGIEAILAELGKIKEEIVSKEELDKAKEFKVGNMYLSLETSDSFADFYSIQELMNLKVKTPEEKAKKIQSVTAKDIQNMAKKLFVNQNLNLAIVGPYKDTKEFVDILSV
jgi:predicted Zn-dependent peptidase